MDGFLAQDYASLGQLKMSYFSILFAFIEVFCCKFNVSPILLIDDVSGELDHIRLRQLLTFLDQLDLQVFLTSANTKFFLDLENINILKVSDGVFS
jgi:recombinational DNA repair ATPase RecF